MKKSAFAASIAILLAMSISAAPQKAVDITVSGYTGASPLANFPVLVRISPELISGFAYADCAAGGADIAFEDAQGNALDREIDTWDTSGESLVWVRIPSLANNMVITMTYKDLSVTAQPACQTDGSVWSAAGYAGVWHMNENSGTQTDRTGNGLTATTDSGVTYALADGPVGTAISKSGSMRTADFFASGHDYTVPTTRYTVSGWYWWPNYTAAANANPLQKGVWGQDGWYLQHKTANTPVCERLFVVYKASVSSIFTVPNCNKNWNHLTVTYDGTYLKVYVNGASSPALSHKITFNQGSYPFIIGNTAGYADETRVLRSVASPEWISASYATQKNASFLTYGASRILGGTDILFILGAPDVIGSPSPAYGVVSGLSANDSQSLSMPVTAVPGEGTVTNVLSGWKLESVNLETTEHALLRSSSDEGEVFNRCDYVHAGCAEFTWLWNVRDALGVGAPTVAAKGGSYFRLSAHVNGIGYTAPSATLKFVYGVSPDAMIFTNVVSASVTNIGELSAPITRLTPGTAYYVKAVVETNDEAHDIAESDVVCLTTDASALPDGYIELEYIEGTGAQYVNTGYCPSPTTRTLLDFQLTAVKGQYRLFGVEKDGSGHLVYSMYVNGQNATSGSFAYARKDTSGNWTGLIDADALRHTFDFNHDNGAGGRAVTISGTSVDNRTLSEGTPATATAKYPLFLGAPNKGGSTNPDQIAKYRLYSCRLFEDEELVRDFIPAYRTSDSAAGLYDLVNGVFYPSASATSFIPGASTQFVILNASLSRSRLNATVSGSIGGFDGNSSATVSLWAGTSGDANSFTQVGQSITVTDTSAFTFPWTLPAFDTQYWWQIRAVGDDLDQTADTEPASVIAPAAVVFTGASGGDWHTASNWELGTVPSAGDGAIINGKWVKATNSISTASITITGNGSNAGLVVGGTTLTVDGVKAQTAFSSTSAVPYSITLSGDLVLNGACLSLGARREVANVSASIGGDFIITNGAVAAIYAGRTDGVSLTNRTVSAALLYANANVVAVGGELLVGSRSYLYAENEGLTGTPVFFKPSDFTVEQGGVVSAFGRGWGKYKFSSGSVFPVGALADTADGSYYSYAFGQGESFDKGGCHGSFSGAYANNISVNITTNANGSKMSARYTAVTYDSAYAPFLPGSPNGCYSTTVRGGGSVCVFASGTSTVAGTISANADESWAGGASGGSIWLGGSTFHIARSASITANGGKSNYSSAGGGGRIALTAGATQAQLDSLAGGADPDDFATCDLYGFSYQVLTGLNGATRYTPGTAKLAWPTSSHLPVAVGANPEEVSTASPSYGFHVLDKAAIPTFTLADQSTYPALYRDLRRFSVQGYVVSNITGEVSGTLSAETDPLTLTWQWTGIEDCVRIRPVGGGSITVNGTAYAADADLWFATGTPLTISATSGTGTFSSWYGDFGTGHSTDATLAISAHPGLTVWGVFSDASTVAKSYVGADNGFWDVASNWTPAGVPTPMDEVTVSSKQVKSYGLSAMKSLTLSAGKLAVGGASAATTTAQTRPTDADIFDCGLVVVSNLSATGASAISIGARRQKADLLCATIGGDLSLAGSSTLSVYAPAYEGPLGGDGKIPLTNYYHSAFPVSIGGNLELAGTSVVYPESDIVTGNSVRFDVGGDVTVGASASFNATTRGWGWINYVDEGYTDPRYTKKDGNYYTLSTGYGYSYTLGGVYGADGSGTQSGFPRKAYGFAYAPYLNGGPDGTYSPCRGGGTVWVKTAGLFTLNGSIVANGGTGESTSSKSAGGGVWICADDFEAGSGASIRANGEGGGGNNAPGTGGRISIALAVSDADLDALARGETPSRLSYSDTITIVTATATGGSRTENGVTVQQPDGTLTTVMGAVSSYPLAVASSPLTVVADGLDYSLVSVPVGQLWSATAPSYAFAPSYPNTVRYSCAGWVISNSTEQVAAGFGTTASFTPELGPFFLTWIWSDCETASTALSNDGELGGVAVNGGEAGASTSAWSVVEGSVSLSATPAAGAEFLYWVGDVPCGQAKANPIVLPSDEPRSLTAIFRAAEAATARTWVGAANAVGRWEDPSKWSPANIPGFNDEVSVPTGTCLASNYIECASLSLSGAAKLKVGTTATKLLEEVAVVVHGDLTMTNTATLDISASSNYRFGRLTVGDDLVLAGTNTLTVCAGPITETRTFATGAGFVNVGGNFSVLGKSTVIPVSSPYTGGSVVFRVAQTFTLGPTAKFFCPEKGYARVDGRIPITLCPGRGNSFTIGGGYGGTGWGADATYGKTYGFANAPIHPGAPNGGYSYNLSGSGLVRVHAQRVHFRGAVNAKGYEGSATYGGPSGGGVWITSAGSIRFGDGASVTVKGGAGTNYTSEGGGGRIAFGIGLSDTDIAELAETGELHRLPAKNILGLDAFSSAYPNVSIDISCGRGTVVAPHVGTFRFLDARRKGTMVLLK